MAIGKFAQYKDFLSSIRDLGGIFEKADRKALESAVQKGDLKEVCSALHVSEERLTSILKRGAIEAAKIARENPDVAVDAVEQHTANGQRP